jgi:hypothetical protein
MKNKGSAKNVLLVLLTIGVWGLLLRPFFATYPANAQSRSHKQYAVVTVNGATGKWLFDGSGAGLTTEGVQLALAEVSKRGWKVHSVVPYVNGFVVIAEK